MKLKCNIKEKEYDIVQGATFKEEFNETLDSGSIIIDHVSQMNIKPYDDVFIYEDGQKFLGYMRNEKNNISFPMLINREFVSHEPIPGELGKSILTDVFYKQNAQFFMIKGLKKWAYYTYYFSSSDVEYAQYKITLYLQVTLRPTNSSTGANDFNKEMVILFDRSTKVPDFNMKLEIAENVQSSYRIKCNYDFKNDILYIEKGQLVPYETDKSASVQNVIVSSYVSLKQKVVANFHLELLNSKFFLDFLYKDENKKSDIKIFLSEFGQLNITDWKLYKLKVNSPIPIPIKIPGFVIKRNPDDKGITFLLSNESNRFLANTTSENIDSDYFDIYNFGLIFDGNVIKPKGFYKHFLINNISEELINIGEKDENGVIKNKIYKYKIDLMSETKGLEKIQLPNLSITPSRNVKKRLTVYEYMENYVKQYSPKIKKVKSVQKNIWEYANKYILDASLQETFKDIYAPEMTLNAPTLKDVLSRLMVTKDMIPYVKDDTIYGLDISKSKGKGSFKLDGINYINGSMTSENYASSFRRNYSEALSQDNTISSIENIGFRNMDAAMLTIQNMRLELKYPIYKLNKVYLCYYKKINTYENTDEPNAETKVFLCKQDITPLVLENSVRNALTKDWTDFEENKPTGKDAINKLAQYRICTLGYSKGSRNITGWGETYEYAKTWWTNDKKIYLSNIMNVLDDAYPFGIYSFGYVLNNNSGVSNNVVDGNWQSNIITPYENITNKIKSFFFQVDYKGFYNGALVHNKDGEVNENIVANDNSSTSLSLLEVDGLFEKEKINRFGNKTLTFSARYENAESIDVLNDLSSVYEDDIVIYSREYSIWDNVIFANYTGTKDYIMKNYFTSVWSKHRTYNLMSYGESVTRAENVLQYVTFSKDKLYFENNDKVSFIKFSNVPYTFCGALIPSIYPIKYKDDFIKNEKMNSAYFRINQFILDDKGNPTSSIFPHCYFSDWTSFVCGYSLCYNTIMIDNATSGTYVDDHNPDNTDNPSDIDLSKLTGSTQKWHMIVDDPETGFVENISVGFAQIDQKRLFLDTTTPYLGLSTDKAIKDGYYRVLFNLPLATEYTRWEETPKNELIDLDNCDYTTNIIKLDMPHIRKDNKEKLDVTLQFDINNLTDNVIFSQWFLKLSDFMQQYEKIEKTYSIEEINKKYASIQIMYYTHNPFWGTISQGIVLRVKDDILNDPNKFNVNFLFAGNSLKWFKSESDGLFENVTYYVKAISFYKVKKIVKENNKVKQIEIFIRRGEGKIVKKAFEPVVWNNIPVFYNEPTQEYITLEYLDNNGPADTYTDFLFRNELFGSESSSYRCRNQQKFLYGAENTKDINTSNSIVISTGLYDNNIQSIKTTYKQNMFIWGSSSFIDKNNSKMVLIEKPNDYINITSNGVKFSDVVSISKDQTYFKIDLSTLDLDQINSIQYWFYDKETESYNFVMGVNLTQEDKDKGFIKVYISLISQKNENIVDVAHNIIGKNKNYVGTNLEDYGTNNLYDLIVEPKKQQ